MIRNLNYEIYTPSGFQNFEGIELKTKPNYFKFSLSNGRIVDCSFNHPFIVDGKEREAYKFKIGDSIDSINNSKVFINKIEFVESSIDLYDIIQVTAGNVFIADEIISHNCDCDFLSSGATVLEPEILKYYLDSDMICDPIQKRGIDSDLWIWKEVDFSKSYLITADVARGDGTDYSAFHVMDIDTLEIVAEYKGKIPTTEYGHLLYRIGMEYNQALLVIENTGIGHSVTQVVIDLNYPNLFYTYKNDPYFDQAIQLKKGHDLKEIHDKVPGIGTNHVLRPIFISKLETYFREKLPIVHSKRLISELRNFIWKNGRAEAQSGWNDDLVMALAIALYIRDTALRLKQAGMDLTRAALKNIHKSAIKGPIQKSDPFTYVDSMGNTSSYRWLFEK